MGVVFILIKKRNHTISKSLNKQNNHYDKVPKKKKVPPKEKKGANCRAIEAKANAAPTTTTNTPKERNTPI